LSELWLSLLGVDTSGVPEGATTEFTWTHAPQSWGVFVLLAVAVGVIWGVGALYRREQTECPRRIKTVLAGLRIAVLVLLLVVWLGPALAVSTQRTLEPYVVMLVDESLSMSLADRYTDDAAAQAVAEVMGTDVATVRTQELTRAQVIERLLAREDAALVRGLAAKGKLRVMSFAGSVKERRVIGAAPPEEGEGETSPDGVAAVLEALPPLEPVGASTNMAQAIREAMRSVSGEPLAAVVVISDGQNTEGDDPRGAAESAASENVPIFTVGVGDPSPAQNLRVAEVWAPDSVFRDDPFVVQAQLRAEGMAAAMVEVTLVGRKVSSDGALGPEAVWATQTATVGEADTRVSFEHKPTEAGDYVVTVRITPQENELLESDNARSTAVKVLSDQARVLLIAGSPSWEYRMVSTLLKRDKTTDISCFLQSMDQDMRQEGNTVIDRLPRTAEDLFKYDLVIFMDADPSGFDELWIELIQRFCNEHAGGVMWMAGPQYTQQFLTGFRTRQMADLLPVRVGELGAVDVESLLGTHTQGWPLKITAEGADHAMLRLDKDAAINRQMWEAMPAVYWTFPVRQARPGAQVLIEHSDPRLNRREGPRPLLVAGQVGPGRTVYMGFEGTWRWRKLGEKYFDRFWIQAVRYLAEGRLLGARKRGRIGTDRDVYAVGSRVAINARLFDAAFGPLTEPSVTATVKGPGGQMRTVELGAVPNQPGDYQGSVIATQVGLNEIAVILSDPSAGSVQVARQVTVEVPRVEFADPRLNVALLSDLADRTGGRYFTVAEAVGLPAAVDAPAETIIIRGRPIELWDTNRLLILLVVLLTAEWALRKRFKLL
jgi:hypothetical protein